jgi:hypothetical protein
MNKKWKFKEIILNYKNCNIVMIAKEQQKGGIYEFSHIFFIAR